MIIFVCQQEILDKGEGWTDWNVGSMWSSTPTKVSGGCGVGREGVGDGDCHDQCAHWSRNDRRSMDTSARTAHLVKMTGNFQNSIFDCRRKRIAECDKLPSRG